MSAEALRCTLGLTKEQLAQKLGIDESTIAGWERGENPPVGAYRKLLENFITGDGPLPPVLVLLSRLEARSRHGGLPPSDGSSG